MGKKLRTKLRSDFLTRLGKRKTRYFPIWVSFVGAWGLAIALSFVSLFTVTGQLQATDIRLPAPQIHPLPPTLAQWEFSRNTGDYFEQVESTPLGYLVWSEFPVKVYLERPADRGDLPLSPAEIQRFQVWSQAILTAVEEWNAYLPLTIVEQQQLADVVWERSRPPLRVNRNRETGQLDLPTARSGEARYELYVRAGNPTTLAHRFTIRLSPHQTKQNLLAAARHELGHALGIWGHSSLPTDVLYPRTSGNPPPVSARDVNTLKKIYQQPTQLGWTISTSHS